MRIQGASQTSKIVFVGTSIVLAIFMLFVTLFAFNNLAAASSYRSPAAAGAWQPENGPYAPGGKVTALAVRRYFDGDLYLPGSATVSDTLYAAVGVASSTLFRSLDSASSWSPVYTSTEQLTALDVAGTEVYVASDGASGQNIYYSPDEGVNWTEVFTGLLGSPTAQIIQALAINPVTPTVVYAAGNERRDDNNGSVVLRTTDGGANWTAVLTTPMTGQENMFRVLAVNPVTPTTVYVAGNEGVSGSDEQFSVIYRTLDGGANWTRVYSDTGVPVRSLVVSPFTPTLLFAGTTLGDDSGHVLRSSDGGDSWSVVVENTGLGLVVESPEVVYAVSTYGDVHKSNDSGDSWQPVATLSWDSQPLIPGNGALYVGSQDRLLKSSDGGVNWATAVNGILSLPRLRDIDTSPQDPNKLFVTAWGGGGWLSSDGGQTWSQPANMAGWWEGDLDHNFAWMNAFAINSEDPDIVYGGSGSCHQGSVLRSADGGLSFTPVYTPGFITGDCAVGSEEIATLAIAPTVSSTVYAGGHYCYQDQCNYAVVVRSLDDGVSWSEVLTLPLDSTVEVLAIDPLYADRVYAGGQICGSESCHGFIYRTEDAGANWTEVYTASQNMYSIVIAPHQSAQVYAADQGYRVYKSADSGATWSVVRQPPWEEGGDVSGSLLAIDPEVPNRVYLGGWGYVAETVDGGQTWDDAFSMNLPGLDPSALQVHNHNLTQTVYAGFGGLWSYQRPIPGFKVYLPLVLKVQE